LIGADISSSACVSILVVYLIIQQIENNLLVPYVQGKYLKISPSLVFFGMLFGAAAGGIVGMILSLPIVATIKSYWK
jgi:predicted PurR-regulated permease PerM